MFLKTFMVNVQNLVEGESQKKKDYHSWIAIVARPAADPYKRSGLKQEKLGKTISGF